MTEPVEPPLPDLTQIPFAELLSKEDTVLDDALRRILEELDNPNEVMAAHTSFVT